MARIRKSEKSAAGAPGRNIWKIGLYSRLSREDGNAVSCSVVNQNQILHDELPVFFEEGRYEVVDEYVDDGTSGTTDAERRDFQRMVRDVKAGRINCIVVKNLSRAFRNSANQGRFLEEFIPLYQTRFISLYEPRIDTFLDPEVVHSLEVSITGFLNEQYAYKTSVDVRRTFQSKMRNGEFIGAFAPYGYAKDPENKNALIVDEEAAQTVRDIFDWFVREGMSKRGIVKRLNELGIRNPTAYKRAEGLRYSNPHAGENGGLWCARTVAGMLTDPLYIGVLRQGRQRVISYKVHKRVAVPEDEWRLVENVVPPIVDRELFDKAQAICRQDTRTAPGRQEVYPFSGLVRCADCKRTMTRKTSGKLVYYCCRTYRDQSKRGCSRHTIRLDALEQAVLASIRKQTELLPSLSELVGEIGAAPVVRNGPDRLEALLRQRAGELKRAEAILDGLYCDWKNGDVSRDQYRRLKEQSEERIARLRKSMERIQAECRAMAQEVGGNDPDLTEFLNHRSIRGLSRGLLVDLVRVIEVREDGSIEITFNFADPYRRIAASAGTGKEERCADGGKAG